MNHLTLTVVFGLLQSFFQHYCLKILSLYSHIEQKCKKSIRKPEAATKETIQAQSFTQTMAVPQPPQLVPVWPEHEVQLSILMFQLQSAQCSHTDKLVFQITFCSLVTCCSLQPVFKFSCVGLKKRTISLSSNGNIHICT